MSPGTLNPKPQPQNLQTLRCAVEDCSMNYRFKLAAPLQACLRCGQGGAKKSRKAKSQMACAVVSLLRVNKVTVCCYIGADGLLERQFQLLADKA